MTELSGVYVDGRYEAAHPDWHASDSNWKAERVLALVEEGGLRPADVCEVGCGVGGIVAEVAERLGVPGSGYDISPGAIERARELHPEIAFTVGSLPDRRHDLVLVMDVVEHVEDPYGFVAALRGIAQAAVFNFPLDLSVQTVLRPRQLDRIRAQSDHLHFFTKETALATIRSGGFEIESYRFAPAFELAKGRIKATVAHVPRRLGFRLSPGWTARTIGGCCLFVLAR